jgi:cell division protease FtsH
MTKQANPPPPGDRPTPTAPPPPPAWRQWLWPVTIDAEVARLVREAEPQATELLTTHRDELRRLADRLLEYETVDGTAVYGLLGTEPPTEQPVGATIAPHRVDISKEPATQRSNSADTHSGDGSGSGNGSGRDRSGHGRGGRRPKAAP